MKTYNKNIEQVIKQRKP